MNVHEFSRKNTKETEIDARNVWIEKGNEHMKEFFEDKKIITVDDLNTAIMVLKISYNFDSLDKHGKHQASQDIRMILATYLLSSCNSKTKPGRQTLEGLLDSI